MALTTCQEDALRETAAPLMRAAAHFPDSFGPGAIAALVRLSSHPARAVPALQILVRLPQWPRSAAASVACACALEVVAGEGPAVQEAASLLAVGVGQNVQPITLTLIEPAIRHLPPIPRLVSVESVEGGTGAVPTGVEALFDALVAASPKDVLKACFKAVRRPDPFAVQQGCRGIARLMRCHAQLRPAKRAAKALLTLLAKVDVLRANTQPEAFEDVVEALRWCLATSPATVVPVFLKALQAWPDVRAVRLPASAFWGLQLAEDVGESWSAEVLAFLADGATPIETRYQLSQMLSWLGEHGSRLWPAFTQLLDTISALADEAGQRATARIEGTTAADVLLGASDREAALVFLDCIASTLARFAAAAATTEPETAFNLLEPRLDAGSAPDWERSHLILLAADLGCASRRHLTRVVPFLKAGLAQAGSAVSRLSAAQACERLAGGVPDLLPDDLLGDLIKLITEDADDAVRAVAIHVFGSANVVDRHLAASVVDALAETCRRWLSGPRPSGGLSAIGEAAACIGTAHPSLLDRAFDLFEAVAEGGSRPEALAVLKRFAPLAWSQPPLQPRFVDALLTICERHALPWLSGHLGQLAADDAFRSLFQFQPKVVRAAASRLLEYASNASSEPDLRAAAGLFATFGLYGEAAAAVGRAVALLEEAPDVALRRRPELLWLRCQKLFLEAELCNLDDDRAGTTRCLTDSWKLLQACRQEWENNHRLWQQGHFGDPWQFPAYATRPYNPVCDSWVATREGWLSLDDDSIPASLRVARAAELLADLPPPLDDPPGDNVALLYTNCVQGLQHALRWHEAIRAGADNPTRFKDAAIAAFAEAARNAASAGQVRLPLSTHGRVMGLLDEAQALAPHAGLDSLLAAVARLPLPPPLPSFPAIPRFSVRPSQSLTGRRGTHPPPSTQPEPGTARVQVFIDQERVTKDIALEAAVVHSLQVNVETGGPTAAGRLHIQPSLSLPERHYAFTLAPIELAPHLTAFTTTGILNFFVPHAAGAEPHHLNLVAYIELPDSAVQEVELLGDWRMCITVRPPAAAQDRFVPLAGLSQKAELRLRTHGFKSRLPIVIQGPKATRMIVTIAGRNASLTLAEFRLFLRLVVAIHESDDGYVPLGDDGRPGLEAEDWLRDGNDRVVGGTGKAAERAVNNLRDRIRDVVLPMEHTDFIEIHKVGRRLVRLSTDSECIEYDPEALRHHTDRYVRALAERLPARPAVDPQ